MKVNTTKQTQMSYSESKIIICVRKVQRHAKV